MKNNSKRVINYMSNILKDYKSAQDGVAAIEFIFVAPIMILMYFGLAEISLAISTDRKISHSINVGGDLATQVDTISATEMTDILSATILVMDIPDNKLNSVKIDISSFSKDADDNIIELGTAKLNGGLPAFKAKDLDKLILSDSSGVVVARIAYDYEPLQLKFFDSNFTISETFLLKPRVSDVVTFDNGAGVTDYTCTLTGNPVRCT